MTTTAGAPPERHYGGWQHERMGFMFGLSGPRFTLAAIGALLGFAPIMTRSLTVLVVAWPLAVAIAALVFVRVLGKTSTEWVVLAVSFTKNKSQKRNLFFSGAFAPRSKADPAAPAPMDLPGALAVLRFLEAETGGVLVGGTARRIAVAHHPLDQTYTVAARIRYAGLALADTNKRELRVGGWGAMLAQLCNEANPFSRVAVLQRTVPDDGTALRRWYETAVRADAPALAVETVEGLMASAVATSAQHEAWLVLTLDAAKARHMIKSAGGGDMGALAVLVRQVGAMSSVIGAAQLEIIGWLGLRDLAEVLRTAFDPSAAGPLAFRRAGGASQPDALGAGVDPRLAGPAATAAHWSYYRHDSGFSVTYEVQSWPRVGVPAWFLRPVLTAQRTARRGFAMVVEPLGPRRAERELMQERTKRDVAVRLRKKSGQIVPEHEKRDQQNADRQDRLRAEGHGTVRFVGYLTVTVEDYAALDLACSELETDAAQCGLEVRRLWGAQDVGFFAAALPLGLGLPKTRVGMI